MAKTTKEKNQMDCNKKARAKYDAAHFSRLSVKLKNEEMDALTQYCKEHGIAKNTLIRQLIMQHIGQPIVDENS